LVFDELNNFSKQILVAVVHNVEQEHYNSLLDIYNFNEHHTDLFYIRIAIHRFHHEPGVVPHLLEFAQMSAYPFILVYYALCLMVYVVHCRLDRLASLEIKCAEH
jgi:hypothetical protein